MKKEKTNPGVSDVLGTILLLGMAVALFSVLSAVVLSYPFHPSTPEVNIIGFIDGNNIILEHLGGENLGLDTRIIVTINNTDSYQFNVNDDSILDDNLKNDGYWNIGENVVINATDNPVFNRDIKTSKVDVTVVDVMSNSVVLMGTLQEKSTSPVTLNNPPDAPVNPSPADGATDVNLNPILSVEVFDPDGDSIDVTFYNASDNSVIGVALNIASGGIASITWSGLSSSTTYSWYTIATDGIANSNPSDTWSFTTLSSTSTVFSEFFSSDHPLDTGWTGVYPEIPDSYNLYDDIYTNNNPSYAYDGYYMVTKDDAAAVISISTTGYENIELSYYRRTVSAHGGDRMVVEWRAGGSGDWIEIERTHPSDTWSGNIYSFPDSANNQPEIQIRFWLDDGDNDYALWDNIIITGG